MRSRLWAAGAAAWTVAFIILAYANFRPAAWYVTLIAVAGALALCAAVLGTDGVGRTLLLGAIVILIPAAMLAGLTGGPVLIPAVAACALGVRNSTADLGAKRP